jgi:hypothetical protein
MAMGVIYLLLFAKLDNMDKVNILNIIIVTWGINILILKYIFKLAHDC